MSDQNHLGSIFFQYDLYPDRIESTGKVKKLFTSRGKFALKQTTMTSSEREWFDHVLHRLKELNFSNYVPIYPTKFGDDVVVADGQTYYLMPWVEEASSGGSTKEKALIEDVAAIHALTEKEQTYSRQLLANSYRSLLEKWHSQEREMERFAKEAEKSTFLSPFQFTFVSNYPRTRRLVKESKQHLSDWYDMCERKQNIRGVLCHGKLSAAHFILRREGGQLFNFERAVIDTPVRDLAVFFRKTILFEEESTLSTQQLLACYENRFSLLDEEKSLLASFLVYPEYVYLLMKEYHINAQERTESEYVQRLEKAFAVLKRLRGFNSKLTRSSDLNPSSQKSDI